MFLVNRDIFVYKFQCTLIQGTLDIMYPNLHVGNACDTYNERTIMLVGVTGSGKSTLVDGIINYILGVNFDDPFRFKMVVLENEERKTIEKVSATKT